MIQVGAIGGRVAVELPPEVEPDIYESLYPDLRGMCRDDLVRHYWTIGCIEGRTANSIGDRKAFAQLAIQSGKALEIGPLGNPLLGPDQAVFADVMSTESLRIHAEKLGKRPERVPKISYVVPPSDLGVIDDKFETVLSSHALEHQPDLLRHLNQVHDLLLSGGRYFVLIPDHRYCFDHFRPPSNLAQVLGRHLQGQQTHSAETVLQHAQLRTHNDAVRHWKGDHGDNTQDRLVRIRRATRLVGEAGDSYVDSHAWHFTPQSWRQLLADLGTLGLCHLEVERTYPTRLNRSEFWTVLKRPTESEHHGIDSVDCVQDSGQSPVDAGG